MPIQQCGDCENASGSNTAGDVAKVQVTEGKQTQFRYLAAIEKIEAVGKDIYTFANGRIINLPGTEEIGGKAALHLVLHVRMHRTRFNPHAGESLPRRDPRRGLQAG